jgi:hypothetical protein
MQWDSIFQKVGRRGVVELSEVGRVQNVEVAGDAVRPVGEALAGILASLPLRLPVDSVRPGDRWEGDVQVPVRRPDGTRSPVTVPLEYRLRRIVDEPDARFAHLTFDGRPIEPPQGASSASGIYTGEAVFAVHSGRFERLVARAEIEVGWPESEAGLPSSHSGLEWQGSFGRSEGGS